MIILNSFQKYNQNFQGGINPERISHTVKMQTDMVLRVMNEVRPNICELQKKGNNSGAKSVLEKLKEFTCVDVIFENGLSFVCGDKRIKVFNSGKKLRIKEENAANRRIYLDVELNDDKLEYARGFIPGKVSVEEFLKAVCEKLDFPLLQLRRFFIRPEITNVLNRMSPPAVLSSKNIEVVDNIRKLFSEITSLICSIKNYSTRAKIKNGYVLSEPAMKNSKQISLRTSGSFPEIFSVNVIKDNAGANHLIIRTSMDKENWQNIIVDTKNRILKEKSINLGRNETCGKSPVYYTQTELDSPIFWMRLSNLQSVMEAYKEYLQKEITKLDAYNYRTTTKSIGYIDKKTLLLIDNIKLMFDNCKRKMHKLPNADTKEKFKKLYKIETEQSKPCLIFKDINSQGEGIHISFQPFNKKPCIKLIVIKPNGNPGKCFLIQDGKLIKFETKSFSKSKRTDTAVRYHSQEEIDQSGLREYLHILNERLAVIPMIKPKKVK